jgi:hypothetical protein
MNLLKEWFESCNMYLIPGKQEGRFGVNKWCVCVYIYIYIYMLPGVAGGKGTRAERSERLKSTLGYTYWTERRLLLLA